MKAKYILVSLLLVALVMTGTGYSVSAGYGDKVTGGGTFVNIAGGFNPSPYADYGDKISFGFNAQGQNNGSAKGQFHLINHDSGMKIFGTISECSIDSSWIIIEGTCLIDGVPTPFWARLNDGSEGSGGYDLVRIGFSGTTWPSSDIYGQLSKGNIQWHG